MLDIVIVDDEPLARARLRRLLAPHPGARVVGEADSAAALRGLLACHTPHVVILDIEMQGEDGLSVGRWLAEQPNPPALIFVTAHPQFALEAFSVRADGYLLKPVSAEQLNDAIEAACRPTRAARHSQEATPQPLLTVSAGRRERLLAAEDILAFRAEDKGVTVFVRGEQFFVDGSLKELEQRFEPAGFLRVHRAWLVAQAKIGSMERDAIGHHWLNLRGLPEPVPVSRRQLGRVQARLRR